MTVPHLPRSINIWSSQGSKTQTHIDLRLACSVLWIRKMNNSTASTTKESDGNDSVAAFLSSFIFNAVIALIIILVFSYLRPKHEKIYQPYFKMLTEFLHDKIPEKRLSLLKKLTLSSSFFAWLTPAFKLNDNELYEVVGFDAFVYLRFIRLCFKILAFSLPYAAIVLIPINVVDGEGLTGLDRLTLGNISDESDKLWAHLIGVWMFSLILYYFMYVEWKVYVKYRQIFLKENSKQHFSVLVTQLPQEVYKNVEFLPIAKHAKFFANKCWFNLFKLILCIIKCVWKAKNLLINCRLIPLMVKFLLHISFSNLIRRINLSFWLFLNAHKPRWQLFYCKRFDWICIVSSALTVVILQLAMILEGVRFLICLHVFYSINRSFIVSNKSKFSCLCFKLLEIPVGH